MIALALSLVVAAATAFFLVPPLIEWVKEERCRRLERKQMQRQHLIARLRIEHAVHLAVQRMLDEARDRR